jgi:hypothetical protein
LSWPLPAEMTDEALEAALFAAVGTKQGHRRHLEPDWAERSPNSATLAKFLDVPNEFEVRLTRRWREPDSNRRSRTRGYAFGPKVRVPAQDASGWSEDRVGENRWSRSVARTQRSTIFVPFAEGPQMTKCAG